MILELAIAVAVGFVLGKVITLARIKMLVAKITG